MANYVPLPGSTRRLLPDSTLIGAVDPAEIANLTVRLRSRGDAGALAKIVYEQANQPLATRKYLTHDELAEREGASEEDLDRVEKFAKEHHLLVVHRKARERSILLKGSLGDLLSAFHANIHLYRHSTGTYRGREGEIEIPKELASIITGVFGYDTRPKRRLPRRKRLFHHSGTGGSQGVAATKYAERYNFPSQYGGVTLDGAGQTIAIIALGGGFRSEDLKLFFKEIGVDRPEVVAVSVDRTGNHPTTINSADAEVMLDLEVAGAVAPKATLVVYFAPNKGNKGFLDAISAAVHDAKRRPTVISISWGGPESSMDQQGINAFHELFAAAGALGITICAAAGDHGTADLDAQNWDQKIHVDHPTVDDLVLACGGTQIVDDEDVVWNDGTSFDKKVPGGGGWATGGGISQFFPVPPYQAEANLPVSLETGKPGRGLPDLAMNATNYAIRVDGISTVSGGTSAVAPLMAGLVARLNQAKMKRMGFMNPFLYANAGKGIFRDVTKGTNAIFNTVKGYQAGSGWDACSGLGTPDGTAILNLL